MKPIGKITHYYGKVRAAVVELHGDLEVGDLVRIEKEGEGFEQKVTSMRIEDKEVEKAKKGETVSMKVIQIPRKSSLVLLEE